MAFEKGLVFCPNLPFLSISAICFSLKPTFPSLKLFALCLSINLGISIANSCGGTYGQVTIKHMSHIVHASTIGLKSSLLTESNS